ncbi:hypothetical protein C8F04DRAFT_1269965 [Mycena alexandri]|uniref:Uncharacterized protein n=1 Tax=Mycena alexandri TaxID=1745969 RepID=A0AAD6WTF8_9AGAR|nr:hypothetical protein C8F04DRAFT_1269965 [Mycena alexandri]
MSNPLWAFFHKGEKQDATTHFRTYCKACVKKYAALAEADDEAEVPPADPPIPNRIPAWKPLTLRVLFSGVESCTRKPSAKVMEEEELLMEELANAAEDENPDDGGIEIDSDDEFRA